MKNTFKKAFIILVAIIGINGLVSAQGRLGIKASVGTTLAQDEMTFVGNISDYINHEVTYKGSNNVKSFGIFGQKRFGFLFARAEVAYTTFKQEYYVRSFVQLNQGPQTVYEKWENVDFQVLGGLSWNNFRLGVGPVAHVLIGKDTPLDFISGYNENPRDLTWGFTTALGYDFSIFSLDLRYENNFTTVGDHINYGTRPAKFHEKPHIVNVTLGISF